MPLNISGSIVNSAIASTLNYKSIVTRGLVLHLDPSAAESYPQSGTVWCDLYTSSLALTLTNGPTYDPTAGSGSIVLDGIDDYVSGLSAAFMDGASTGTFEAWVNISNRSSGASYAGVYNVILGKASGPDNAFGFDGSGYIALRLNSTTLTSSAIISLNTWGHVVGTWDTSGMRLYLNGSASGNNALAKTWETSIYPTQIGRLYSGSANGSFVGKMGNIKVYNRSLSAAEILQNYNAQKSRFGY
jgi:hypothetical protein